MGDSHAIRPKNVSLMAQAENESVRIILCGVAAAALSRMADTGFAGARCIGKAILQNSTHANLLK